MKCCPVPSTSCDLFSYKVWSCYVKGLGGDAFTRKFNIWPLTLGQGHTKCCPVPSTSCDLFSYKVWSCYVEPFRRRYIYKKIHYLTLTLGSRSHKMSPVPSTLCDLLTYEVWSCYLLWFRRRYIYKKIHYLTFDLDLGVKVTRNVTQYPLHHVTYSPKKFEAATSYRLGGDTFTRNGTQAHTDGRTDGRRTDFDTKLIYPFF